MTFDELIGISNKTNKMYYPILFSITSLIIIPTLTILFYIYYKRFYYILYTLCCLKKTVQVYLKLLFILIFNYII